MRITLAFLLSVTSPFAFAEAGKFRGHSFFDRVFSERTLTPGTPVSIGDFIVTPGTYPGDLLSLLGGNTANGPGQIEFRNGEPNSVNMLLWYLGLDGISRKIGQNCLQRTLAWEPSFQGKLLALCEWPSAQAKSETVMQSYWLALMGYDAPESEYQAWREFFLQSSYANKPADEAVAAMSLAILYNPHFLLNK